MLISTTLHFKIKIEERDTFTFSYIIGHLSISSTRKQNTLHFDVIMVNFSTDNVIHMGRLLKGDTIII